MTNTALPALRSLTGHVLRLAQTLDDDDWVLPSACPGWSVQDVLIHMTCTFRDVTTPGWQQRSVPGSIERSNDLGVAAFRGQSPATSIEAYRSLIEPALASLAGMQEEPRASERVDFDDAGLYRRHQVADSLAFDHYCHLRHDIAAPRGLATSFVIEPDETLLRPCTTWLLAGLPQMSASRLAQVLVAPVLLELTGPGGGRWVLRPSAHGGLITVDQPSPADTAAVVVRSDADRFQCWSTGRTSWQDEDLVIEGDTALAGAVLDAVHAF